jgi:hypothetical protein
MVRVNDTVQLNAKVYDGAGYMVEYDSINIKWYTSNYNCYIDSLSGLFVANNKGRYNILLSGKVFTIPIINIKQSITIDTY